MPIYEFECECGRRFDKILPMMHRNRPQKCSCGKMAGRIESVSGPNCGNEDDETWAKSCREVMPSDSNNPHVKEFMRNPTKGNLKKAMKSEGLRHIEPGEKPINRTPFDLDRHADKVAERFQRRQRVEI